MGDTYLTRETLLKRMKSRTDEEAWEEFIGVYKGFIYSAINKMGISDSDGDDLSQKVLLKVWESLPRFDTDQKQGKFRNWLYTITKNTVLDFISKSQFQSNQKEKIRSGTFSPITSPEIDEIIASEWESHIAAMAFTNVAKKVSQQALDAFQSGVENETVEVTAGRLGLSENSVYVYRMRVKNALIAEINNLREMLE